MIDKNKVIEFFNNQAPFWDENQIINTGIVETILDNAGVSAGQRILDVACGTGVMIPYYLNRNVRSVTGIDISSKMLEIAETKYASGNVSFFRMDAESEAPVGEFDVIVIFNAFPHFTNPGRLLKNLSSVLAPGGVLTVAHGMSREKIDSHHSGIASEVSNGLPEAEALAELFSKHLTVTKTVSTGDMYQVVGIKDGEQAET